MSGFTFNLTDKMAFSKKGNPENFTLSLEFKNPGMDEFDEISDLSQLVQGSIVEVSRSNMGDNQEDPDSKDVLPGAREIRAILMSASEIKFSTVASKFKNIALKTCTLDGEVKLTNLLISRMSVSDYTRLVCEYIAFFIIPSLLSEEGELNQETNGGS